jgi:beta-lactamase regulating signal transducer with metallopeptidase domain
MTDGWAASPTAHAIAAAIVDSIWQGAAIGLAAAAVLRALRRASPNVRYLVSCAALLLLAAVFASTVVRHAGDAGVAQVAPLTDAAQRAPAPPARASVPALPGAHALEPASTGMAAPPVHSWRLRVDAWAIVLVPLWLLGVCLCSARLALAWAHVRRLRRAPLTALPRPLHARLEQIVSTVGVRRALRIAESAMVQVPMVVGWLRPIVLLPASALSGLAPSQLEAIVAHEIAHIRRHDFVVNIVQSAVEVLLFYHPACWWLSRQIRDAREQCCDDIAVAACGDSHSYASALATLEELRGDSVALTLAASDGPLLRRIRRLVAPRTTDAGPAWIAAVVPAAGLTALLLATSIVASAAQSAAPSAGRTIPPDRGIVEGQVTDAATGRGIAEAKVELAGPVRALVVATGVDGRYSAEGLEPGNYRVSVRAPDYITRAYGASGVGDIGTLLKVEGGRLATDIDIKLESAAAVSGRILDEHGEGLQGIEVELLAERSVAGVRMPAAVNFAQSEESGAYRFKDVLPGEYLVRAYKSDRPSDTLQKAATVPAEACKVQPEKCPRVTRSTFYPSAPAAEQAQLLHVYSGQELFDTNVTLLTTRTYRVAGRLISPGDLSETELHLMSTPVFGSGGKYDATVKRSGEFEANSVPPGKYMVMIFDRLHPTAWLSASRQVVVEDTDVTDLVLVGHLGGRVEGRIVADASANGKLDPARIIVTFEMATDDGGIRLGGGPRADKDGGFSGEAPGGPLRVRLAELPKGWMVRAISVDGNDATDRPFDFGDSAHRIEVVLTDRLTRVTGHVYDKNGLTIPDATVLVFPDDRSRWAPGGERIQPVNVRRDGSFDLEGLPPSDYLAVDATRVPSYSYRDPDVLEKLRATATRFRLGDGEQRVIRVVGGER